MSNIKDFFFIHRTCYEPNDTAHFTLKGDNKMEALVIPERTNAMSTQECVVRVQKTIEHIQLIERLLDEKVQKEMETIITKHAHIQSELNE